MKGDITRYTFDPRKHYSAVLKQQGRVDSDADWYEQREIDSHLRRTLASALVGASGVPADNAGFELRDDDGTLVIGAGQFYVDGTLCENEEDVPFTQQPDLPGQLLPSTEGDARRFLAYLDVWERHVTAIEDPGIREVALGGADTTTRKRTVCQVRLVQVDNDAHCLGPFPQLDQIIASGDGELSAQARPPEDADEPCSVSPGAGYIGLKNQTYRVEIHQGGGPGEASYLWDEDNASFAWRIEEFLEGQATDRIRLRGAGRSDLRLLRSGDLLEITDDNLELELNGEPGLLRRIVEPPDPSSGLLVLDEPVDGLSPDLNPIARRWTGEETIVSVDGFLPLGDEGVEVRFQGNRFRRGDYWLIPARTATRDVEWPTQVQEDGETEPLFRPPLGIRRHYQPLALIDFGDSGFSIAADCRVVFSPLALASLKVEALLNATDNQVLAHNSLVRLESLARGLDILFNLPLSENILQSPTSVGQDVNPELEVELYLPEPSIPSEREFWGLAANEFFGYRPVILRGDVSIEDSQRARLGWRPIQSTRTWLQRLFQRLIPPGESAPVVDRLLCKIHLRGGYIWANGPDGGRVFLDGEVTANPLVAAGLDLPSGNGRPSRDFFAWFWVISDDVEVSLSLSVDVRLNLVSGIVSSGGAPIENAIITLRRNSAPGAGSEQTTESDAAGQFSFPALEGDFTVIAEVLGSTVEQDVEVGPVIVAPGGGGGITVGPGDLTVNEIEGIEPRFTTLLAANGVRTVAEFAELDPNRISEILPVSVARARELRDLALVLRGR